MNIVVLCGGLSNERDVSLATGAGVARALKRLGHRTVLLDSYLGCSGNYADPSEMFERDAKFESFTVSEEFPELEHIRALRGGGDGLLGPGVLELCRAADLVFIALHGGAGEDGRIQAALDVMGVKYTGCGSLGCAAAMDKALSKTLLRAAGIPVPEGYVAYSGEKLLTPPAYSCVVKPCAGGSSVGMSIVNSPDEFAPALKKAFCHESRAIVEKFIDGRELTVGVLDGKALPVIEIISGGAFDYRSKYQSGACLELCPAPIGERESERVSRLAEHAARALMIDVYCRVDFLWAEDEDRFYCLEANALPGLTPVSLFPKMAEAQGMGYDELCGEIMRISMNKYSDD